MWEVVTIPQQQRVMLALLKLEVGRELNKYVVAIKLQ